MTKSGIGAVDDVTSMCRMVIRELSNCIKYNDTNRVRYHSYPAKLDLKEFDITKCNQWASMAPGIKQLTQSSEFRDEKHYYSTVGILLHTKENVELIYLL